ncbi:hypothetical protein PHJA_001621900 [Phtheirospermum japonicum]|uniref:Uncharacterized protein n=1 Tax=Phtheirospermum japonicum TaxID=374723 RepID=A0A830CI05_9LAMI|nr:hypothetical protein PHJA_001621900 [Phtheirospermum japonicum]
MPVDLSTPELREKDYQAFREKLELIDQVRDCVLCPPGFDFTEACPCHECGSKISELNDFEKEIKAKKKLITEYAVQEQAKEDLCMLLIGAAFCTNRMLDLLHKSLKAVSEKSEVPSALKKSHSAAKLGVIYQNMTQMLIDSNLIGKPEEKVPDDDADAAAADESYDVLGEIDSGFFYYKKTKAKDKAYVLLQEIEKLEKHHEMDKKTAEAQKKALDPSISRGYIEKQIELVKMFPVEELQLEAAELIAEICPRDVHLNMFGKARQYISNTCAAMITKRKAFCRGCTSPGSKGKEHSLNGLDQTLDWLIEKANSFKKQWKEEYAPYFTPRDRSDPKRQRAE